jgi:hypothetical protein
MTGFTTAAEAMQTDETNQQVSMLTGLVKFDGKFANRVQNSLELPKFLHELYETLKRVDPLFQMGDQQGNAISIDALPDTFDACVGRFNLQVVDKRDHQHVMFVVNFDSKKTIGVLKKAAIELLKRNSLYMNRHPLSSSTLDVATSGWILGAHPRYHSPTVQQQMIEAAIQAWWVKASDDDKSQWGKRFNTDPKHNHFDTPNFFLNARAIRARDETGRNIHEAAFLVVSPITTINALTDLLEEVFQPTEDDGTTTIQFIPARLQKADAATYFRLALEHRQYLKNSQNVSIAGLHREFMNSSMTLYGPDGISTTTTLELAFLLHPSINRIDPASYNIPLGKWNVTTHQDHAEAARKWIDHVIEAMPSIHRRQTGFADFPDVIRMQSVPAKNQARYSKYSGWHSTVDTQIPIDLAQNSNGRNRAFSQNPQEPNIPPILTFTPTTGRTPTSYAQAASTFSNRTTTTTEDLTHTSSITTAKFRAVDSDVSSLKEGWKVMMEKMDSMQNSLDNRGSQNGQSGDTPNPSDSGVERMMGNFMKEILRKMANNHDSSQASIDTLRSTSQTRFDTLEDQQSGASAQLKDITKDIDDMTVTMDFLRDENVEMRTRQAAIMDRMDLLEGAAPYGSPVRKQRSNSEDMTDDQHLTDSDDVFELREITKPPGHIAGAEPARGS